MLFFPRPWIFSSFAWINWHSAQYLEGTLYITPKFSLRFSLFSVLCLIYSSYLCIPNKGFHWAISRFPSLCHDSLKIESKEELTLFIFLISEITVFQCLTSIVLKCVVLYIFQISNILLSFFYRFRWKVKSSSCYSMLAGNRSNFRVFQILFHIFHVFTSLFYILTVLFKSVS